MTPKPLQEMDPLLPAEDVPNKILKGVKKLLADDVSPQLSEIRSDVKVINVKIEAMDKRIGDMDKRLSTEIAGVKESMNVVQRLAVLEQEIKDLKKNR